MCPDLICLRGSEGKKELARALGVWCRVEIMVDFDTLIASLRRYGYTVQHTIEVPGDAGSAEFMVDGQLLSLAEVRGLLEVAEAKEAAQGRNRGAR